MNVYRFIVVMITLLLTMACSDKKTPEPVVQQPTGVIPQAQLDALNKAKALDATLQKNEQQRRKEIDQ